MIEWVLLAIFLLIGFYLVFLRPFLLRKKKFRCLQCGRCCRLAVRINNQDIERLKKAGYVDFTCFGKYLKKDKNGNCVFQVFKRGKSHCSVHKIKPGLCARWPNSKYFADTRCTFFFKKFW
jgi:Fe-S-cluster containining protein